MRTENLIHKSKTSFYIYDSLKIKMAQFIPSGRQTDFINNSLKISLESIEREAAKTELLAALKTIKKVKRKTTARETLEKLREKRNEVLLGKKKYKS